MKRRFAWAIFLAGAAGAVAAIAPGVLPGEGGPAPGSGPPPGRLRTPNLVLILADDLGWGSANSYGADEKLIRTPQIDRLAREGRRFTDANTPSSVCSPTRYGLLTGRYCWRTALDHDVLKVDAPLLIEPGRLTLASLLKARGYRTAAIGKWHLGYGVEKADFTGSLRPGPLELGFDYHFGVPQNHGDETGVFVENDHVYGLRSAKLEPFGRLTYGPIPFMGLDAPQRDDAEVMEILTQKAVSWIEEQSPETPFFLYFATVAVHLPITPSFRTKGTSGSGPYGDWIHEVDRSTGALLGALDRKGLTESTLVIFTSDNGGVVITRGSRPEAQALRAGLRINGHWRGRKHSIYEGGFRVPFLARWPGRIPAGSTSTAMINLVDVLATMASITGQALPPSDRAAEDSIDVLPALLGQAVDRPLRASMVLHSFEGNFAIRTGRWKYIEGKPAPAVTSIPRLRQNEFHPQLYNLARDPDERSDLIQHRPRVVRKLRALLKWSRETRHTRR